MSLSPAFLFFGLLLPFPGSAEAELKSLGYRLSAGEHSPEDRTYKRDQKSATLGEVRVSVAVVKGVIQLISVTCDERARCMRANVSQAIACQANGSDSYRCTGKDEHSPLAVRRCAGTILFGLDRPGVDETCARIEKSR